MEEDKILSMHDAYIWKIGDAAAQSEISLEREIPH
jgi:hypothetical protein